MLVLSECDFIAISAQLNWGLGWAWQYLLIMVAWNAHVFSNIRVEYLLRGGGLGSPKKDYVICEWSHTFCTPNCLKQKRYFRQTVNITKIVIKTTELLLVIPFFLCILQFMESSHLSLLLWRVNLPRMSCILSAGKIFLLQCSRKSCKKLVGGDKLYCHIRTLT